MKLNFEFEIKDWMEFQKDYLYKSKRFKRTRIFLVLFMPVMFGVISLYHISQDKFELVILPIYALLSLLFGVYIFTRFGKVSLKQARKILEEGDNSGILGPQELVLNEEGILLKMANSEHKTSWKGIKKLVETDAYYFLYNTAASAIIIPKKKVEPQLEELEEVLRRNIVSVSS